MNGKKLDEIGMDHFEVQQIVKSNLAKGSNYAFTDWTQLEKFVGPHGPTLLKAYRIQQGKKK